VHERAVMTDVMNQIDLIAMQEGASRVTLVAVRLGALSHFTPQHFLEHFQDVSRGTIAEGAQIEAVVDDDLTDSAARDVILERMEIELPDPVEAV
jgi:hydrogenase nickel incorporation protein HypA/HybF